MTTQMLRVAADQEIWSRLRDRPRTSAELAAATGAHERRCIGCCARLAGLGLLERQPEGWALTPLGAAAADIGRLRLGRRGLRRARSRRPDGNAGDDVLARLHAVRVPRGTTRTTPPTSTAS